MRIKTYPIFFLIFLQALSLKAEEMAPSAVGEAARAVVDRVFGVKGEAGQIEYHIVELTKVSPANSAIRSVFLPGWGQHFNRQRVKGTLFFFTFAAAAAGSLHLRSESKSSFDDYKRRGLKDDPLYDEYEDQKMQSTLLGIGAGILWTLSVFDAYRNAYNPLYTKNIELDLAYQTDETSIRLSRKF